MSASPNSAHPSRRLNDMKPKLVVFASGTKEGGGSGFENLVVATKTGALDAEIVAVVSNHEHGGVRNRADKLGVPFVYFAGPYDAPHYQKVVADVGAEWIALSGWLRQVQGLDPKKTFNIHPALLSQLGGRFGGSSMYGVKAVAAVIEALQRKEIDEFGISMHFVTEEYDQGPVFFEHRIPYTGDMTKDDVAHIIHESEHEWQPKITNMVVHGEIRWDGKDPETLVSPIFPTQG